VSGTHILAVTLVAECTLQDDVQGQKADGIKQLYWFLPVSRSRPLAEKNLQTVVIDCNIGFQDLKVEGWCEEMAVSVPLVSL